MKTIEDELQTSRIENEYRRAFLSILFTANLLQHRQKQLLEPFGISGQQYNVLRILRGQKGNCLATYSIKDRMVERNSDASRMVDRLLAAGYVERISCPNDKRSTLVKITSSGLDLLAEIEPQLNAHHQMPGLTADEAAQLCHLLDKVRHEESSE